MRELEVLKWIVQGYKNKEIAERMHISVKTIEKHRAMINYKLKTDGPIALIRVALRDELVTFDEFFACSVGENTFHHRPGSCGHGQRNFLAAIK